MEVMFLSLEKKWDTHTHTHTHTHTQQQHVIAPVYMTGEDAIRQLL